MSNPQVGSGVQVRAGAVSTLTPLAGVVVGHVVLGTPNKADVAYFLQLDNNGNSVNRWNLGKGLTQDDTLSADGTFKVISGGA